MMCHDTGCRCPCPDCDIWSDGAPELAAHCWAHRSSCHVGCATTDYQRRRISMDEHWANYPLPRPGGDG